MSGTLELVREEKLFRLLPGQKKSSRLEASGVALADNRTALVVFDNLNQIARIDLSLKRRRRNRLMPTPSPGTGFEDIAIDDRRGHAFCLIEALEDVEGVLRGLVAEYDRAGRFVRCTPLSTRFEKANKGFEGLTHAWIGRRERLFALHESGAGRGKRARGRVDVFERARGEWQLSHRIRLPKRVEFDDYAALSYRKGQLAVVSQASARVWVVGIDEAAGSLIRASGRIYRFPSKRYGNVEGVAWLSRDLLVAVSDRRKKSQPARCAEKDQAIHVFRIPG
jgi:uncharacterized protein YjiK